MPREKILLTVTTYPLPSRSYDELVCTAGVREDGSWVRMIKDHMATSFHIELEDLDFTPFDSQGGRGKMWALFGTDMENVIQDLNESLVA